MINMKTPDGDEFTIDRFVKRRRALRSDYSSDYQGHHREIYEHFRPRRGFYLTDSDRQSGSMVDGKKRHQNIINSTVIRASKNAQSGLQAGVTSPSRPWKKLGPADGEMLEVPGAREAFDELDKMMDFVLSRSNFYRSTHTAYGDFVLSGVSAIQIDPHPKDVLRTQVHPVGSWVAATNADGKVDVFYRDYKSTGHEIRSRFADLPPELAHEIKQNPYKKFDLHNAIEPNPFYRPGGNVIGLARFPYLSVWWAKGYERNFLKVHGYYEFPVLVFRMATSEAGDVYGHGLGMDALGEAKQMQHQENMKLQGIDKLVLPPLQAPSSLRQSGVSLIPGHITYHDGQNKVESLYNLNLPLGEIRVDIQEVERRISELFFEDLFLMITRNVGRETTAREIEERHEEKLIMLGPVLESIHDELLDPAIDRVLGIMRRSGVYPEFPETLEGVDIRVEYTSILAQAQTAIRTISMEQGVNFATAYAAGTGDVSVLDRIDPDGLVEEYFQSIGFPGKAQRSKREAEGQRAARAQAQQQEAALAQAGAMATAARDASAATDQIQPNVLQGILQGVQ